MDNLDLADGATEVQEYDLGVVAASRLVVGFGSVLHGWAIAESTGAAVAKVRIHDGRDAASPVVAPIALPASGTSIIYATGRGIECEVGVYLEVVAGSVEAVLYLARQ